MHHLPSEAKRKMVALGALRVIRKVADNRLQLAAGLVMSAMRILAASCWLSLLVASCGEDSGADGDGNGGKGEHFARNVFSAIQRGDSQRFASYILPDRRSRPENFEPSAGDLERCDIENADMV